MGIRQTVRKAKFARRMKRGLTGAWKNAAGGFLSTLAGLALAALTVFAQMEPTAVVKLLESFGLQADQALAAAGLIGALILTFGLRDGELGPDEDGGGEDGQGGEEVEG